MKYYGLDWIGMVLGLASIYFMGRRIRLAFHLRIAASLFWAAFGVLAGTPAAVLANVAAILLCLLGNRATLISPPPRDASRSRGSAPMGGLPSR